MLEVRGSTPLSSTPICSLLDESSLRRRPNGRQVKLVDFLNGLQVQHNQLMRHRLQSLRLIPDCELLPHRALRRKWGRRVIKLPPEARQSGGRNGIEDQ